MTAPYNHVKYWSVTEVINVYIINKQSILHFEMFMNTRKFFKDYNLHSPYVHM